DKRHDALEVFLISKLHDHFALALAHCHSDLGVKAIRETLSRVSVDLRLWLRWLRLRRIRHTVALNQRHSFFGSTHRQALGDDARGELVHRSEEHTSELQSRFELVCRLLL